MNLNDLISDTRTSLDEAIRPSINIDGFQHDLERLSGFNFWHEAGNRPQLWEHQKAAIGTITAYLNGDKSIVERPDQEEAALLKLPTGTGKSGIIAVIARCLPEVRRVLVLTPRTALTEQLIKDIRFRFWSHIGYEVDDEVIFTATAADLGEELENVYTDVLLPKSCQRISERFGGEDRVILVGTHQALGAIRKSAFDTDSPTNAVSCRLIEQIKDTFDLVIVDEGHYEPAISWSRGVREFNLPTILLSATPYRNDYKSFRVRGRYVFNFPYADAVEKRIIRPAQIIIPDNAPEDDRGAAIQQFVQMLSNVLPPRFEQSSRWFADINTIPKVMVRGDDLDTLELLQTEIDEAFRTESILIHDRAKKTTQNPCRFTSVASAKRAQPDAQFWIHQNKLLEGIDDQSFVAVAIFDLMSNARQLVQQIGRATRISNGDKRVRQMGWVIGSPANAERIKISWERYMAYEKYVAENTAYVVTNEVTLPDRLLQNMAEYQYINGEFRGRFEFESPLAAKDVQLPQSSVILAITDPLINLSLLAESIEESIMDKDRFKVIPIVNCHAKVPHLGGDLHLKLPHLIC